jgi:hypothetical protein
MNAPFQKGHRKHAGLHYILIFFSEITETIESKPGGNVHWMDLYNIYGGREEGCCHQKSITETKGLKMPSMLLFSVFEAS